MGYQDKLLVEYKNCKHTESGICLSSPYCKAYGCSPLKKKRYEY